MSEGVGADAATVQLVPVCNVATETSADAALGSLWVVDEECAELVRVEISTGRVLARMAAGDPEEYTTDHVGEVYGGEHTVWLQFYDEFGWNPGRPALMRIDPMANQAMRLDVGLEGTGRWSAVVAAPPRRP